MSKPKREFPYPKMTAKDKELIYDYLCACREDFWNGREKMMVMWRISKEEWIQKNILYFQHCVSAVDYCHAKLRLSVKSGSK